MPELGGRSEQARPPQRSQFRLSARRRARRAAQGVELVLGRRRARQPRLDGAAGRIHSPRQAEHRVRVRLGLYLRLVLGHDACRPLLPRCLPRPRTRLPLSPLRRRRVGIASNRCPRRPASLDPAHQPPSLPPPPAPPPAAAPPPQPPCGQAPAAWLSPRLPAWLWHPPPAWRAAAGRLRAAPPSRAARAPPPHASPWPAQPPRPAPSRAAAASPPSRPRLSPSHAAQPRRHPNPLSPCATAPLPLCLRHPFHAAQPPRPRRPLLPAPAASPLPGPYGVRVHAGETTAGGRAPVVAVQRGLGSPCDGLFSAAHTPVSLARIGLASFAPALFAVASAPGEQSRRAPPRPPWPPPPPRPPLPAWPFRRPTVGQPRLSGDSASPPAPPSPPPRRDPGWRASRATAPGGRPAGPAPVPPAPFSSFWPAGAPPPVARALARAAATRSARAPSSRAGAAGGRSWPWFWGR
eukprot:scaffold1557_cov108-Isochrysis_galbana.AAC.5